VSICVVRCWPLGFFLAVFGFVHCRRKTALHSSTHSYSHSTLPIALSSSLSSYRYILLLPFILIPQRLRSSLSLLLILYYPLLSLLASFSLSQYFQVHFRLSLPYLFCCLAVFFYASHICTIHPFAFALSCCSFPTQSLNRTLVHQSRRP
jgi:hypothetical protein